MSEPTGKLNMQIPARAPPHLRNQGLWGAARGQSIHTECLNSHLSACHFGTPKPRLCSPGLSCFLATQGLASEGPHDGVSDTPAPPWAGIHTLWDAPSVCSLVSGPALSCHPVEGPASCWSVCELPSGDQSHAGVGMRSLLLSVPSKGA